MSVLDDRWATGKHVGAAKPTLVVKIRTGMFRRRYYAWGGEQVDARIYGESASQPWMPQWDPTSSWQTIPGVRAASITQDFTNNGIAVLSLQIENITYPQRTGPLGQIYHLIARGALSPYRGMTSPIRGAPLTATPGWYGLLARNAQITVYEGYGDAIEPTFTGLIDDCDLTSHPDTISVTARDFGQCLMDQHVFGWNKSKQVPEPVVFEAVGKHKGEAVGHDADASSTRSGHPPRFVIDTDSESAWISHDHSTAGNTEWVQVRVGRGYYDTFAIHNSYPDMEVFLGVYAHGASLIDDRPIPTDGWITPDRMPDPSRGGDSVPGSNGGWPYIRHWDAMSDNGHTNQIGALLHLDDESIIRIGYRNLQKITAGTYRAGCVRLAPIKRPAPVPIGKKRKVIECDDVSNIVKVALRWAGFQEWTIEDVGTQMNGRISFNRANTLMDIVKKVQDATGYVFYIAPPTSDDLSIGIPTFVSNDSIKDVANLRVIRDSDLLTGVQVKSTDEPLGSVVRVRGKPSKKYGLALGQQHDKTLLGVYRPPWHTQGRLAGILKHVIHTEPLARHTNECLLIAQMIALQEALVASAATIEVPGTPRFALNEHVAIVDTGTGLNTRLFIAQRSSEHTTGPQGAYRLALGGALVDTADVQGVITDMRATLRSIGANPYKLTIGDPMFSGNAA